jgi:hypothetical protein
MASHVTDTFITNKNLYSVLPADDSVSLLAVLGVLNSRLISYLYINQVSQATKDDFPQVTIKDVSVLPYPTLEGASQKRLTQLVEQILDLNKRYAAEQNPQVKTVLQQQIDTTDRQIDLLVYALYALTEEEIAIVESA